MPLAAASRRWVDAAVGAGASPLPGLHPLVGQALARRGITTAEAAQGFLDPSAYRPAPARELPGMEQATARLARSVEAGERICVWGDFDVDGQTALDRDLAIRLRALGWRPATGYGLTETSPLLTIDLPDSLSAS